MSKTLGRSSSSSSSFSGSTTNAVTAAGTSLHLPNWTSSSSTPANSSGVDGDFHLNESTNKIYKRTSGSWVEVAHLTGPTGAVGADAATPNWTLNTSAVAAGGTPTVQSSGTYPNQTVTIGVVTGATGSTGPQGIQGEQGETGATGPAGADGADAWDSGTTLPTITSQPDGSFFFKTDDHKIYKIVSGAWAEQADITGPQGPQGPSGTADTWLSGTADPTTNGTNLGDTGNFYYQETSPPKIYKKTNSTTWTLRATLSGPTGPKGDTGDQGAQGQQGIQGEPGTDGVDGTDGSDGATWTSGSGTPSGGAPGDFYFQTGTDKIFKKTGSNWGEIADITGPQGSVGPQGPQGDTGETGAAGDDADTPNWTLSTSTVAAGGTPTIQTTGTYPNQTITFGLVTGATGSPGEDGEDGEDGQDGADGATWRQGSSDPADSLGSVGDFYLNSTSRNWFEKTSNTGSNDYTQRGSFLVTPDWDATSGAAQILNKPTTITSSQASAIVANTAKVSNVKADWNETDTSAESFIQNKPTTITSDQAAAIVANTAKVGITTAQANAITANSAKVSNVQANWNETSSSQQSFIQNKPNVQYTSAIPEATSSQTGLATSTQITKLDGIAASATANDTDANLKDRANHTGSQTASTISDFDTEVSNNTSVAANTAKVGITTAQADAITANTAKVGITTAQADAITANTAKVGITTAQANAITANTAKVSNVKADWDETDTSAESFIQNKPTSFGDVSISGTPSDNQIAVWTDSSTVEGQSTLTKPSASSLVLDNNGNAFLRLGSSGASSSSGGAIKLDHYSGGNSLIENYAFSGATSNLILQSDDKIILRSVAGQEPYIEASQNGSVTLYYDNASKLATASGGVSVTGDITVSGDVDGRDVAADGTKLDGIESGADVTDATNVDAAGAVMNSDTTTASMSFVVDEDDLTSNSDTKVPTQQSVKAYVDSEVSGIVSSAPAALNTLNELAEALGDDAAFSTTVSTALGNRVRTDTASQGLSSTEKSNARTNIDAATSDVATTSANGLMSSSDKSKLDGVAAGAEVNVQSDWDASSGDAQILNKPNVQYTSAIPDATSSQTGLATSTQITKLDGIEAAADVTDSANVKAALPSLSNGQFLTNDGTDLSWASVDALPTQSSSTTNKFLKSTGTAGSESWETVDAFPSQSGNSGKFLTTDGSAVSWDELPQSGHNIIDESGSALTFRDNMTFKGELVAATDDGSNSTDITMDAKTSWLYG